jgi:RNA polymerase sigma-70 factor (ECF subfamily)
MLEQLASYPPAHLEFGPMISRMSIPPGDHNPEASMQLVIRAKAGDQMAMELLCSRYLRRLQSWAHGRLPPWARGAADTQDLAQETLSSVVQKLAAFEPKHDGAFEGYVFRAMINRVLDEIRKAQRRPQGDPLEEQRPSLEPSPFDVAVGTELRARYDAALLRLPENYRDAIVARIELELSWAEVAEALGKKTVPAAQMQVSRALVKLAREMSHER